jgi:hypothetical protein
MLIQLNLEAVVLFKVASFWFYLIVVAVSLLGGFIGVFIAYLLVDWWRTRRIKKKAPSFDDIRLANPGNIQEEIKEVEEKEKNEFSKFREFERLRRMAIEQGRSPTDKPRVSSFKGDATTIRREVLQNENTNNTRKLTKPDFRDDSRATETKQSPSFTRPEFL